MKVCVLFERSADGGWGAYTPGLPGVGAVGRSVDEVRKLILGAIELHIQGMNEGELAQHETPGEFAELVDVGPPVPEEAHWQVLERAGITR